MQKIIFQLTIIIIILSGCLKEDTTVQYYEPDVYASYIYFKDLNERGFYVIDNRLFFKYMMYHYDIESEKWTVISERNGLKSPYFYDNNYFSNFQHADSISVLNTHGDMCTYFKAKGNWKEYSLPKLTVNTSNYYPYYDNNFINENNGKVFKIQDTSLYALNNNNWSYISHLNMKPEVHEYCELLNFISNDTLLYLSNERFNGDISTYFVKINLIDGVKRIIPFNFSKYGPFKILTASNNKILFNYSSDYYLDYGSCIYVYDLNKLKTIDTLNLTITENDFYNPLNVGSYGNKIYFYDMAITSVLEINNQYYIFINDVGFCYNPQTKQFKKLPYLDFKGFNKKE